VVADAAAPFCCADTHTCCLCLPGQDHTIPPGEEGDYQINRFCEQCLVKNYNYTAADYEKAVFVCPRCKGMNNPNKRYITYYLLYAPRRQPSLSTCTAPAPARHPLR
jgi:NMD protein affecting ribosome stability and mRNA decay